jgi:hypothetical protein
LLRQVVQIGPLSVEIGKRLRRIRRRCWRERPSVSVESTCPRDSGRIPGSPAGFPESGRGHPLTAFPTSVPDITACLWAAGPVKRLKLGDGVAPRLRNLSSAAIGPVLAQHHAWAGEPHRKGLHSRFFVIEPRPQWLGRLRSPAHRSISSLFGQHLGDTDSEFTSNGVPLAPTTVSRLHLQECLLRPLVLQSAARSPRTNIPRGWN